MKTIATLIFLNVFLLILIFPSFSSEKLPEGVYFRIDIGFFDTPIIAESVAEIGSLTETKVNDKYHYEVGIYKDYILAQKNYNLVREKGFETAEIVAYFNREPIPIDDAFVLLHSRNDKDEKYIATISTEEFNTILNETARKRFYYTVQVGLFSKKNINGFFNLPESVGERVTENGMFQYTYGKYYSFEKAKEAVELAKEYGIEDAFIIAYSFEERIPLERAKGIEKEMNLAKTE